jgi:hypothetical protein
MNAYEHIFFVLDTAVEKDEIGKAELRRYLQRLLGILGQLEGDGRNAVEVNKAADKLSAEIGRRFEEMMHPSGNVEGEDDGLANKNAQRRRRAP